MSRGTLLNYSRLTHQYFGIFISPAILFFAFTGALQTFGLHESNRDHPNYKPAHWIAVLAQIHKKQGTTVPVRRPQGAPAQSVPSPAAADSPAGSGHPHRHEDSQPGQANAASAPAASVVTSAAQPAPPHHNPVPLRIFFLVVCVGLFASTLTGLYMSYRYVRNKTLVTATLIAGIAVPLLLLIP